MYGFSGKILRVNLFNREIQTEQLGEENARKFLGGRGLAARVLFEEIKPRVNPLGQENKIIFAAGPLTGIPFAGNAKYVVAAKSPLTGIYGEALASGHLGPELKFSDHDAIVIEDVSKTPTYLWITNDQAELRDASHLWGKTTLETLDTIRNELNEPYAQVAAIGVGGENLVKFAGIISSRANQMADSAARCGLGAVMGSKKLKAVAIRGTRRTRLANETKVRELCRAATEEAWNGLGRGLNLNGTPNSVETLATSGRLPTCNFKQGTFQGWKKITGVTITKTILKHRGACFACKIACKREVEIPGRTDIDPRYGGPEYETLGAFGSNCVIDMVLTLSQRAIR
jgi:aldehyde:ferredoxin oxidoreductase